MRQSSREQLDLNSPTSPRKGTTSKKLAEKTTNQSIKEEPGERSPSVRSPIRKTANNPNFTSALNLKLPEIQVTKKGNSPPQEKEEQTDAKI